MRCCVAIAVAPIAAISSLFAELLAYQLPVVVVCCYECTGAGAVGVAVASSPASALRLKLKLKRSLISLLTASTRHKRNVNGEASDEDEYEQQRRLIAQMSANVRALGEL